MTSAAEANAENNQAPYTELFSTDLEAILLLYDSDATNFEDSDPIQEPHSTSPTPTFFQEIDEILEMMDTTQIRVLIAFVKLAYVRMSMIFCKQQVVNKLECYIQVDMIRCNLGK